MYGGVPAGRQGEVDDHVHGDQVGHGVVVGSHGAQDPLSSLKTDEQRLSVIVLVFSLDVSCFILKNSSSKDFPLPVFVPLQPLSVYVFTLVYASFVPGITVIAPRVQLT